MSDTKKTQAAEAPKTQDTKTTTNDTATSTNAPDVPVLPEAALGATVSDATSAAIQSDSKQVKEESKADVTDAVIEMLKSTSSKNIDTEQLKEFTTTVQSPTPGRMVTYAPELNDAIYSTAAQTWPAVVTYAEGLIVDLVVFSSNPRTPAVARVNVPHASIAEGRPSWDWPVIKK